MSRIIRGELASQAERWPIPAVEDCKGGGPRDPANGAESSRHIEELRSQVHREAFEQGYREGFESGKADVTAQAARLSTLMDHLSEPFDRLDAIIEEEILALAKILAGRLLQRELQVTAEPLIAAVRDCIRVLPSAARNVRLHLNPEDAKLLSSDALPEKARSWRIEEDPTLERGSLRVESETSRIDARIEARLNEIVAAALGVKQPGLE